MRQQQETRLTGEGKDLEQLRMEQELRQVLGYYDLGELRRAHRAGRGFVNENWLIETTRGRYFLKRRHPDLRNPNIIRAQHALNKHLQQLGFQAPAILQTVRGETLLILAGEFYEIQEHLEGAPCDRLSPAHIEVAAQTLGHYHACVWGFAPRPLCDFGDLYSPTLLANHLTRMTKAWELSRDPNLVKIVHQLETHAEELTALFAEHEALPYVVIHGDFHAGNLLFEGDRIIGVIDYDKACWQPRVVELAEALIYFASTRPGHLKHLVYPSFLDWDKFTTFMRHYGSLLSSSAKELVQYPKLPEPASNSDLARHLADTPLKASEVHALPDYIRCIWLSVSLQRLLEKDPPPDFTLKALQEVVELGNWAADNRERMISSSH
jgi:homoserine kinase type II